MVNITARNIIIALFILFTLYATIRYNIFKGISFEEFPLYILNKSISWTGLSAIALSFIISSLSKIKINISDNYKRSKRDLGIIGFGLIALHVLISIINLNPQDYNKFFEDDGSLNLLGQLSLLFGAIGFAIFNLPMINTFRKESEKDSNKWKKVQNLGYYGMIAVLLHLFFMGYKGWLDINTWPQNLPPITLFAAIIALTSLIVRLIAKIKFWRG